LRQEPAKVGQKKKRKKNEIMKEESRKAKSV